LSHNFFQKVRSVLPYRWPLEVGLTMLISLDELPEVLGKHIAQLRGIVRQALDEFVKDHRALRYRYSTRSEASIIHDYMVWFAKQAGFAWKVKRNLFLFEVGQDFRIKPKRLSKNFQTSNIQTRLVLQFEDQRPLRLFDDLDLTNVFLGYQCDGPEIANWSIWLVEPKRKGIKWAADLSGSETASVSIAVATQPDEPQGRRIKPKQIPATKREASGE
jgi:hypothetical protein